MKHNTLVQIFRFATDEIKLRFYGKQIELYIRIDRIATQLQ